MTDKRLCPLLWAQPFCGEGRGFTMKKIMRIAFFTLICAAMLLFIPCGSHADEAGMYKNLFEKYVINDSADLDTALTTQYDIDDLLAFFDSSNSNEGNALNSLSYSDVTQKFPIEVTRANGYSVYRVRQGGYFYVFWVGSYPDYPDLTRYEPNVFFTAYLSSSRSSDLFDSLKAGESCAEDVRAIDPYVELNFLLSSGTFSYSYLNDETLFQIEYARQGESKESGNLMIEEMEIVSRDSSLSRFGTILSKDLP